MTPSDGLQLGGGPFRLIGKTHERGANRILPSAVREGFVGRLDAHAFAQRFDRRRGGGDSPWHQEPDGRRCRRGHRPLGHGFRDIGGADGRHTVRRNHLDVERQRQTPRRDVVNLIRQTLAAATILFLQEGIVHARFRIQKVASEPSRRLRERHDHRPARELP